MNLLALVKRRTLSLSSRVLYSALTQPRTHAQTPPSRHRDTLYHRISPVGDPAVSIVPLLEGWVAGGNRVTKKDLALLIRQLRGCRRYTHALQVSEWMTDRRYFYLTPGDTAIRLDLICKVHGLEQAEKYFHNIPKQSTTLATYGALLHCYVQNKAVEKAEALFKVMKELGFVSTLTYNVLLDLYFQTGQHENMDLVMGEMEERGIPSDIFAYRIRMAAYVAVSNIDGMESILKRMEDNTEIAMDWDAYSVAANGYIKAGLVDKALSALSKAEKLVDLKDKAACNFLLTLYASTGRRDEVHRIWNLFKDQGNRLTNNSYISMICSLARVDDLTGAEKILEDWETACYCYDFRVPNQLIFAYCKKGLFQEAESVISKAIEKGHTPYPSTWEIMATGYLSDNQICRGVEMMKKALLAKRSGWKPNLNVLDACLEFFKKLGDVEGAEEFVSLWKARFPLTRDAYHKLLRTYLVAGKPSSDLVNRMNADGLDVDEEMKEILLTGPDS